MVESIHSGGPAGHTYGDHVCVDHDGPDAWREAFVPFLLDGIHAGDKLLYVAGDDSDGLVAGLADLPDRDALLASGRLTVMPAGDANGPTRHFDVVRRIATFRHLTAEARAAGYPGLRVAAEASTLISTAPDTLALTGFELAFDQMTAGSPIAVMCGYDRRVVSTADAALLRFVHPAHRHPGATEAGERLYADGMGGWRLTGAVDWTTADQLQTALAAVPGPGDVHLNLDRLRLCDAAATRIVIEAAARLHPTARLVLHDPPYLLRRVLDIGWPGDRPGLVITPPDTA